MRIIVFVEGHTEHRVLAEFLRRWLDPRLKRRVRIDPVRFDGWAQMVKDAPQKARLYLDSPKQDVLAVIAVLDLYGARLPYPNHISDTKAKYRWAKSYLESQVNYPGFRQHFAVHEVEAWLLSAPEIFPDEVRQAIRSKSSDPEAVNSDEPPAKFLDHLYNSNLKRDYKKTIDGSHLFARLDPEVAYKRCPSLAAMLDDMLKMAR